MHEIGIVEDLIKTIQEKIKIREDVKQVKKVYIRLGRSLGLTKDCLGFWFENLSQGTKLEGSLLGISLVDGRGVVVDSLEVE